MDSLSWQRPLSCTEAAAWQVLEMIELAQPPVPRVAGGGFTGAAKHSDPLTFDIMHLEPQVAQPAKGGLGSIATTRDPDCHRRSSWPGPTGQGGRLRERRLRSIGSGPGTPEQGSHTPVECSVTYCRRMGSLDVLRRGQPPPLGPWALGLFLILTARRADHASMCRDISKPRRATIAAQLGFDYRHLPSHFTLYQPLGRLRAGLECPELQSSQACVESVDPMGKETHALTIENLLLGYI